MRFTTLADWLAWQETLHPNVIDLGLERVASVASRMGLGRPANTVITVAGTNGKGSCVALLESILDAAGYRVGVYSSPHLLRYNERVRVCGQEVDDAALCAAFERIDQARGATSLTYFEFGTLAALEIFAQADLDVAVLEVGLGGRLDAVNIVDADVALITSIDIDHVEWLGPDRESIGREKAGILRPAMPAVYGEADPPRSVLAQAESLAAPLHCLERDYRYSEATDSWDWRSDSNSYTGLPLPNLPGVFQLAKRGGGADGIGTAGAAPARQCRGFACRLADCAPARSFSGVARSGRMDTGCRTQSPRGAGLGRSLAPAAVRGAHAPGAGDARRQGRRRCL